MPDGARVIDPDRIAGRIGALLRERRCGAAKPLLAALERLAPEHAELVPLRVAYLSQVQDFPQALAVLDLAVARLPGDARLRLCRSELRFGQADYAGAAQDAADAILLAPALNRAKSVLGLALLRQGAFDPALACLDESFGADPSAVDVALALAALAPARAGEVLRRAIAATPRLTVLRNALVRRHLADGDAASAAQCAEQTQKAGLADAETNCLLAHARMQAREWEAARLSVAQALNMAPRNLWASRLENALASRTQGRIVPLTQGDAEAAEQALLAGGTILPGSFRSLLQESQCQGPVLDLFCGTGLNAIAAREICGGPWRGVEPDPVLRELCRARGLYAGVESCDPAAFLQTAAPYPVILLNEMLGLAASPQPLLHLVRASLVSGGLALAAIPTGSGLNGHGYFGHDEGRIAEDARRAGLAVCFPRFGVLRRCEGIPLHGVIASFRKK